MQYDHQTLYDTEMPYDGFVGGGTGGGIRRRVNQPEWMDKHIWITPNFLRELYGLAKQVERVQTRQEPEALKIKESTRPFLKTGNNLLQIIDYEALFKDRQAKENLEQDLAAFNLQMKLHAEIEKAARLEMLKLKRLRNQEALLLILAEL